MATAEIATAHRSRPSFADPEDLRRFVDELGRLERGEITSEQWRAFRLIQGTYDQRQGGDLHMLRVKVPEGLLDARQLEALAQVAERHSRGFGHVTTRQNLQFHFVRARDAASALEILAAVGITTREACGNSVRNVTACPFAGIAPEEAFDVTPYAEALTRHFLRHPLSASLPRKFKVAFEGCSEDHAETAIHDIGLRARRRERVRGFTMAVGGGTSTVPVSAAVLFDFLPAHELLSAAEAVLRVFHRLGDRVHRERNRMKFLIRQLGWDGFRAEVLKELEAVVSQGGVPLPFTGSPPEEGPPDWPRPEAPSPAAIAARVRAQVLRGPETIPQVEPAAAGAESFARWRSTNVRRQRQAGWAAALVTLPLGDVTSEQLRALAALARAYGDGAARFTSNQNLLLRWVREGDLPALHERLAAAGLGQHGAEGVLDVVSCPGADSCRLAVTHSRGLGRLLSDHLRAGPRPLALAPDLQIRASGCPNGCARHHVAGIGLQGSVTKVGDRAVPRYFVLIGGSAQGTATHGEAHGEARFARLAGKVPARRVPEAVDRLLALYEAGRRPDESATAFFLRVDLAKAKEALRELSEIDAASARPEDFVDLGEAEEQISPPGTESVA